MLSFHASSLGVRGMLAGMAALGLDEGVLCERAKLDRARLEDPDGYLPLTQVLRLWRAAETLWGAPDVGARAGVAPPFGTYEVLDYLMGSAPTVGEAMRHLSRYFALGTTMARWEIEDVHDGARPMRFRHALADALLPSVLRDYAMSAVCRRLQILAEVVPLRVEFYGASRSDLAAYRELYGCSVSDRQPRNRILVAEADWERPVPRRDASLGAVLRRHADDLMVRVPRAGLEESVRQEIAAQLPHRVPTLESVARQLAMSTRTLQRRLADQGTGLSELLEDTRKSLAVGHLGEPSLSISEVGLLLGYSETSAFIRAFKRWTGRTPAAHRSTSDR